MMPYTVIGIYSDNKQPIMEHVHADSSVDAAILTIKQLAQSRADNDDEVKEILDDNNILILDVIEGQHFGILGNPHAISYDELIDLKSKEQN